MSDAFTHRTPPVHFFYVDGPDHLYRDCPSLAHARRVQFSERVSGFFLPDPNGDVCGLCERRMLASGLCEPCEPPAGWAADA